MLKSRNKLDFMILLLMIAIVAGIPFSLRAYDRKVWREKIPAGAKVFTLTGNAERGWIKGDVHAFEILSTAKHDLVAERPVITVSKGDLVVFRLRSSDVIHGFSLKDFGIFITDGIHPGKSTLVSFVADKAGVFTFSCNAICGDMHEKMQGTLIVKA